MPWSSSRVRVALKIISRPRPLIAPAAISNSQSMWNTGFGSVRTEKTRGSWRVRGSGGASIAMAASVHRRRDDRELAVGEVQDRLDDLASDRRGDTPAAPGFFDHHDDDVARVRRIG